MMNINDYKEITKRDGSVIVFLNIEEFLKEYYETNSLFEVESNLTGGNKEQYVVHCPFCKEAGHTKHKLYIKEDMTVGYCFVCTRTFVGITDSVKVEVPKFKLGPMFNNQELSVVKLEHPMWSLDKLESEFDEYDANGVKYLTGRHEYMGELWKLLGFKFWKGDVVMPFFYKGEPFYYQIRFTGNSSIKYFFPPISHKPPYIIEHGDNKQFIICEGVFDAIALLIQAPNYTPFAVLGSSISDYQISFLREYVPSKIKVMMDETDLSWGVVRKLRESIDYCPIEVIPSYSGQDPEERLKNLIKAGKHLQWIE